MGAANSPIADDALPAERRNLPSAGTCTERGKPTGLPVDHGHTGKRAARRADGPMGKGWWKKRMSPCNGGNRG
jgi:hypothetical protein